jgi:ferritin-like metal-binding protein YciE
MLLGAETEQLNQLRELTGSVSDTELKQVLSEHAEQTQGQIRRLEQMLEAAGEAPEGEAPAAIGGLIEDAEMMADQELGEIADVALAGALRKAEHYEIGCYQTAIAMAEQLGLDDVAGPLRESLAEEQQAEQRIAQAALKLIQARVPLEVERV